MELKYFEKEVENAMTIDLCWENVGELLGFLVDLWLNIED